VRMRAVVQDVAHREQVRFLKLVSGLL